LQTGISSVTTIIIIVSLFNIILLLLYDPLIANAISSNHYYNLDKSHLNFVAFNAMNVSLDTNNPAKIVLYPPSIGYSGDVLETIVENETVIFSGYISSVQDKQDKTIVLYKIDNKTGDKTVIASDIVSASANNYGIEATLNKTIVNSEKQIEFRSAIGNKTSNPVYVNIVSNLKELPIPRPEFDPVKYGMPDKIILKTIDGKFLKTINLGCYNIADKYSDNLENYCNLNDPQQADKNDHSSNFNLIAGEKLEVVLENKDNDDDNNNSSSSNDGSVKNTKIQPLFVEAYLGKYNFTDDIPFLYQLNQLDQNPWKFAVPDSIPPGNYDTIIKIYFENGTRAEYDLALTNIIK
jgi:hypothetical protein